MIPFSQCPVCGGDMVQKEVEKLLRGGTHSAVLQVQAEVCLRCGERLYSQETVRRFEQIRAKLKSGDVADLQPLGHFFQLETSSTTFPDIHEGDEIELQSSEHEQSPQTEKLLRQSPPLYVAPKFSSEAVEKLPPEYISARNQIFFRVAQKDDGPFLPDVVVGDWILVDVGRRKPQPEDYIVLSDPALAGGVVLDEPTRSQTVPSPLHLVQFVRETESGHAHIIFDSQMHTYALRPDLLVGIVVAFFRTVSR